jgi:hypothetical protein
MARSIRIIKYPRSGRLQPLGITFASPKEAEWPCLILIRCGGAAGGKSAKILNFQDGITQNY